MAGRNLLEKNVGFLPAHLTDYNIVRSLSHTFFQEVEHVHLAGRTFGGNGGPGHGGDPVRMGQAQLGGVFDGNDFFLGADEKRKNVEKRSFSGRGSAGDKNAAAEIHGHPEVSQGGGINGAVIQQMDRGEGFFGEFTDRKVAAAAGDVGGERRLQAAAV